MEAIANEIEVVYQEFLNNYLGLIKEFGFKNPIEIYMLFTCMLHKGYLSCNNKFSYGKNNAFDYKLGRKEIAMIKKYYYKLLKAQIFCDEAVCRHINASLASILNATGINSNNLHVSIAVPYVDVNPNKPKRSYEELYDNARRFFSEEAAYKFAQDFQNFSDRLTLKKVKYADEHVITVSEYDGKTYILDATVFEKRIFVKNNERRNILVTGNGFEVKYRPLSTYSVYGSLGANPGKLLSHPILPIDEALDIADAAVDVCRNNKAILSEFQSENKELYQILDNDMKKIRQLLIK